jgi:hypothetical protein
LGKPAERQRPFRPIHFQHTTGKDPMASSIGYTDAHLFVAAIRVAGHRHQRPPSVSDVCQLLNFTEEKGYYLCRNLVDRGIVELIEGAYGERLCVRDHGRLEDIDQSAPASSLEDELKKFQASQRGIADKVKTIKAERDEKRKTLFEEMEKKLKAQLEKK